MRIPEDTLSHPNPVRAVVTDELLSGYSVVRRLIGSEEWNHCNEGYVGSPHTLVERGSGCNGACMFGARYRHVA